MDAHGVLRAAAMLSPVLLPTSGWLIVLLFSALSRLCRLFFYRFRQCSCFSSKCILQIDEGKRQLQCVLVLSYFAVFRCSSCSRVLSAAMARYVLICGVLSFNCILLNSEQTVFLFHCRGPFLMPYSLYSFFLVLHSFKCIGAIHRFSMDSMQKVKM